MFNRNPQDGPVGFVQNIVFKAGKNGNVETYRSCDGYGMATNTGWSVDGDSSYDFGIVKIDCFIGRVVGTFGIDVVNDATLNNETTQIVGYPGGGPEEQKDAQHQWGSVGSIISYSPRSAYYNNDTGGGDSGGPVYRSRAGCQACAFGIHQGIEDAAKNEGVRINTDVFNFLMLYRGNPLVYLPFVRK